jgi:hypothetical protein
VIYCEKYIDTKLQQPPPQDKCPIFQNALCVSRSFFPWHLAAIWPMGIIGFYFIFKFHWILSLKMPLELGNCGIKQPLALSWVDAYFQISPLLGHHLTLKHNKICPKTKHFLEHVMTHERCVWKDFDNHAMYGFQDFCLICKANLY